MDDTGGRRGLSLGQSAAECAILFQDVSASWAADSSVSAVEARAGGSAAAAAGEEGTPPVRDVTFRSVRAWWPGDLVLRELCLALPFGSLTAIVGDVGAGARPVLGRCIWGHFLHASQATKLFAALVRHVRQAKILK
jgi:hypothetical protein